jgi:hypothetical protein
VKRRIWVGKYVSFTLHEMSYHVGLYRQPWLNYWQLKAYYVCMKEDDMTER